MFLKTGVIIDVFHSSGIVEVEIQRLNKAVRVRVRDFGGSLKIDESNPTIPGALPLTVRRASRTSLKLKLSILNFLFGVRSLERNG